MYLNVSYDSHFVLMYGFNPGRRECVADRPT